MTYRVFEVPEYHEFLDALGVAPEPADDGDSQLLRFEVDNQLMAATFDIPGRSFHCRWSRDSRVVAEIFREAAVRLRLKSSGPEGLIIVDFETDSECGQLEVQVSPVFALRDRLLMR
jgi:hypothetical protein